MGTTVLKPHKRDAKPYQNDTILTQKINKNTRNIEPEKEFE